MSCNRFRPYQSDLCEVKLTDLDIVIITWLHPVCVQTAIGLSWKDSMFIHCNWMKKGQQICYEKLLAFGVPKTIDGYMGLKLL